MLVDPAMLSMDERLAYGISTGLPSSPDQVFRALLRDSFMVEHIGGKVLTTFVAVQEEHNKKLEGAGCKGSEGRRAWLTARIPNLT